jgi:hypothetical protein
MMTLGLHLAKPLIHLHHDEELRRMAGPLSATHYSIFKTGKGAPMKSSSFRMAFTSIPTLILLRFKSLRTSSLVAASMSTKQAGRAMPTLPSIQLLQAFSLDADSSSEFESPALLTNRVRVPNPSLGAIYRPCRTSSTTERPDQMGDCGGEQRRYVRKWLRTGTATTQSRHK